MTSALELTGVSIHRGHVPILLDIDLAIEPGEIVALLGPSGAGKSTVVRAALGLAVASAGTVSIGGRVVSQGDHIVVPPEQRGISVVFQDLALWPHLTVDGNLGFALGARHRRADAAVRIAAMLGRVGIAGLARRYPGELSGGERQRVAIARALVSEPTAILLDEPLANLDPVLRAELLGLFERVLRAGRTATLYVTHDPREAAALADRVAIIEAGRLTHIGTPAQVGAEPTTPFASAIARELSAPRSP
jgi:iron(III) transport system ATP-binding protein